MSHRDLSRSSLNQFHDLLCELCEGVKAKDVRSLARLLTQVEREGGCSLVNPDLLDPPHGSLRIGVTGPPGAGKSTLVGELIRSFRAKNWSVGVLAVDPSSSFSHGAILGDRIRYSDHFLDKNVFIRSLGTRGSLGGLSASTYLMLRAYDLFAFDIVLIETVGVGQTELEIVNVADQVGVVLVPESGDSIQMIKAGLLEIANFYIVNKSDRPGAASLAREVEAHWGSEGGADSDSLRIKKVFKTVATEGKGLEGIVQLCEQLKLQVQDMKRQRNSPHRLSKEAQALLRARYEERLIEKVTGIQSLKEFQELVLRTHDGAASTW